jgi:hypothetical protein
MTPPLKKLVVIRYSLVVGRWSLVGRCNVTTKRKEDRRVFIVWLKIIPNYN